MRTYIVANNLEILVSVTRIYCMYVLNVQHACSILDILGFVLEFPDLSISFFTSIIHFCSMILPPCSYTIINTTITVRKTVGNRPCKG
jgi:hypothetical protein